MPKQRSNIIGVLDVGTSKIVCFIARIGFHGKIEVLGIGHHVSAGIKAGIITDIKLLEKSIAASVESAEKMSGESIQRIYVSLSASNCLSQVMSSEIMVTGHEISERDEKKLFFQILDKFTEQGLEVIHTFAYEYVLDGNRGISSPIGMYGNRLSCDYHIISAQASGLMNMVNCVARCQLEIDNYVCAPYAAGVACLHPDEMKLGVTLIEFGGSCTSISVFHNGHLVFMDSVNMGGINITNDIACILSTDFASAERVKNLYGTLIPTSSDKNEKIEVPISADNDGEMNIVSKSLLRDIIKARVEETLEILKERSDIKGATALSGNKIVITGGASQLSGMKELVSRMFSKTVRIGYPQTIDGLAESTSGPGFSTAIGMLIYSADAESSSLSNNQESGLLSGVFSWFKENFSS
jgi:cell division protein FtsA